MTSHVAWIALATLLVGCGSTLEPADSPISRTVIEPEPAVETTPSSTPPTSSGTGEASQAKPPGETEVSFTEAAPPPAAPEPEPKKGFVTPPASKKRGGMFALPAKK